MARHSSPHNQTSVPVLDQDGIPLAPTRPSRARRWLESGKAAKRRLHGRFAVQLLDRKSKDSVIPDLTLGINPGTRTTGLAVTANNQANAKIVSACKLLHRGPQISQAMTSRKSQRKGRRSRLHRRPARFNHRLRKPGWLPPSMQSLLANITTNVRHLTNLFPIGNIIVETCIFDPRLLQDPGITGRDYQESERGHMQIREYVLHRDERTCMYCGRTRGRMETDHIIPESKGGPYRISNLVTACRPCNKAKDNKPIEEFLKDDPIRLNRILAQTRRSLASATQMNQLMPLLLTALVDLKIPFTETDAVTTAYTRSQLGIPKSHVNDAACLGEPKTLSNIPSSVTVIRSVGHGKRQMLTRLSEHGTPRYKKGPRGTKDSYRSYCRLSKQQQSFTRTPGHKQRQRRAKGITSGDLVRYSHPEEGELTGYATVSNINTRVYVSGHKGVKVEQATLLERSNGYRYSTGPNASPTHEK